MILVIGEILFDTFPDYRRIGGAPFNFAFHLKKLGFPVEFVSRVGRDARGDEILHFLEQHGFDTGYIQVDPILPTGRVDIIPKKNGDHEFEILTSQAYDSIQYSLQLEKLVRTNPGLIYFGTLVQRTAAGARLIEKIMVEKNKKVKTFCDLNLRPQCYTEKSIQASLNWADMIKLNDDELLTLFPGTPWAQTRRRVESLMAAHDLETVILTHGSEGSEWYSGPGSYRAVPDKKQPVTDTVGAGDGFAAMAAASILNKIPTQKAIHLAQTFASRICSIKGALPSDENFYDEFKEKIGAQP